MEIITLKTVGGGKTNPKADGKKKKKQKNQKLKRQSKSIDMNLKVLVIKTNGNGLKSFVKNNIVTVNF